MINQFLCITTSNYLWKRKWNIYLLQLCSSNEQYTHRHTNTYRKHWIFSIKISLKLEELRTTNWKTENKPNFKCSKIDKLLLDTL